jgi:hypothetical protein
MMVQQRWPPSSLRLGLAIGAWAWGTAVFVILGAPY